MPRVNITYAQLDIDLLDSEKWLYQCNERQQLLYVKLILLAGRTKNKVSRDVSYLKNALNYQADVKTLKDDLAHVEKAMKDYKITPNSIFFKKFWKRYSYIPGKSKGNIKETQGKSPGSPNIIEDNRIESNRIENNKVPIFLIQRQKQNCPADTETKIRLEFESGLKKGVSLKEIEHAIPKCPGGHCWEIISFIMKEKQNVKRDPDRGIIKGDLSRFTRLDEKAIKP